MKILQALIDLLTKGLIRLSKSPYASPALLVPKVGGDYPLPMMDQAFQHFAGAVVVSVLDLNSAYYQIQLSSCSRRVTAFCTPFGLYEFNKLPMEISVGCQGLSRVVDELFSVLKVRFQFYGRYVYSPSVLNSKFISGRYSFVFRTKVFL
jgi:hypothetical protein